MPWIIVLYKTDGSKEHGIYTRCIRKKDICESHCREIFEEGLGVEEPVMYMTKSSPDCWRNAKPHRPIMKTDYGRINQKRKDRGLPCIDRPVF